MEKTIATENNNLVSAEIVVTGGTSNELEDIYRYGTALLAEEHWSLLEADYDKATPNVSFIGDAPETLVDNILAYIGKTSATVDSTVKPAEEYPETENPPHKLTNEELKQCGLGYLLRPLNDPLLEVKLILRHTEQRHLTELRMHFEYRDSVRRYESIKVNYLRKGVMKVTARVLQETYDSFVLAFNARGVTFKGTVDGKPVASSKAAA